MINTDIKQLQVQLVEDDPNFAELIVKLLNSLGIKQVVVSSNYEDVVEAFKEQEIEFALLDVDLGKGKASGIDFARYIRKARPNLPIVYITSLFTEQTFRETRDTLPSSFLNKTMDQLSLYQAIDLAVLQYVNSTMTMTVSSSSQPLQITNQKVFFKVGNAFKGIDKKDVSYFYAKDKMTYAKVSGRNYPTNMALKDLEVYLQDDFIRIHKTYLVNKAYIDTINTQEHKLLIGDEPLPIGHAYEKSLMEELDFLK
ncbi:MAG: response regulator transcription factor [Saprospiraceae bacterium]|nr:response regulator transcription factor [Saprospiraceae bacterium]